MTATSIDSLLNQAIAAASAAAVDASRWQELIDLISAMTGAAGSSLCRPGPAPIGGPVAVQGTMTANPGDYFEHWVQLDPWTPALKQAGAFTRAGEICLSQDYLSVEDLRRSPYFAGHGRRHDSGHKLFLKVCDESDPLAPVTHLSLNRSLNQAPFGRAELAVMQRLWPHLQRAVQAHSLLRQIQATQRLAESSLDQWPQPCWVMRPDRRIDYANRAAMATLTAPWLRIQGGRLHSLGSLDETTLSALANQARNGLGAQLMFAIPHADGEHLERASARLVPIKDAGLSATAWPHAAALLVVELPQPQADADWIRGHVVPYYRLTPNEGRVLQALCEGQAPEDIAARMGISVETVRTHLRGLRQKTGRRSQVELVRLALGR